jgi:hypothetical protein
MLNRLKAAGIPVAPPAPAAAPAAPALPGRPAPAAPAAPPAVPAAAPAAPAAQTPPGTLPPLTIAPETVKSLFAEYQAAENDEAAFGTMVNGVLNLLAQNLASTDVFADRMAESLGPRLAKDGRVLTAAEQHIKAGQEQQRVNDTIRTEVERFWQDAAPFVSKRLLYSFAKEAQAAHPGLENIHEQAMYCLTKALEEMGPTLDGARSAVEISQAMSRGQGAVLPGGSGLPSAGGEGGSAVSFVEQLRATNAGI